MIETKKCERCNQEKSIDSFYIKRTKCKICDQALRKVKRLCVGCKVRYAQKRHSHCCNECKIKNSIEKDHNGCWLWKGPIDRDGYGRTVDIREPKKKVGVHRLSYEVFKG